MDVHRSSILSAVHKLSSCVQSQEEQDVSALGISLNALICQLLFSLINVVGLFDVFINKKKESLEKGK